VATRRAVDVPRRSIGRPPFDAALTAVTARLAAILLDPNDLEMWLLCAVLAVCEAALKLGATLETAWVQVQRTSALWARQIAADAADMMAFLLYGMPIR
jgi:hypothetical protein